MSGKLKWQGADNGREGLLKADKWFATLKILSRHEGESFYNLQSPMYADLFEAMPNESWLGKDGDRPLFRDYRKCWVEFGALRPTEETDQLVELTAKGRELIDNEELSWFFRYGIDGYIETWQADSKPVLVSPFEIIAHAIILAPEGVEEISNAKLQQDAEQLASIAISTSYPLLEFDNSTGTNKRRFRSYLYALENAGAIECLSGKIRIIDRKYLEDLVRDGTLAILPNAVVMSIEFDWGSTVDLPSNITEDLRERKQAYNVVRRGQSKFRRKVLNAYDYRCCVTNTGERSVLQAAHIMSYMGRQTDFASNGLLMAVDVHELFDCGKLLINPDTLAIELADDVNDSRYLQYQGQIIRTPTAAISQPNREALKRKYQLFKSA